MGFQFEVVRGGKLLAGPQIQHRRCACALEKERKRERERERKRRTGGMAEDVAGEMGACRRETQVRSQACERKTTRQ
jgi:hypothetical protein